MLASSIRSPALYDPQAHPEAAKARWQFVLNGMVAMGKLAEADAAKAKYPTVRKKTNASLDDASKTWAGLTSRQVTEELEPGRLRPGPAQRRRACGWSPRSTRRRRARRSPRCGRQFADQRAPDGSSCGRRWSRCSPQTGDVLAY